MPIKIPDHLPAADVLRREKIFVMPEERAIHQDIRELKILILNLMPLKQQTETQLLRLLGNSPLQVEITLMAVSSYEAHNTSQEYLLAFYHTFEELKDQRFDGMIITGAPVEHMEFEEVAYWKELTEIMEWSKTHVTSTLHICWGAQAGLYYHYGIPKRPLDHKMFGIFPHHLLHPFLPIFRGFDDEFYVPHSRHTEVRREDILRVPELTLLSESEESGVYMAMARGGREFFITGHSEYAPNALHDEYIRDLNKGLPIDMPKHYYRNDHPEEGPVVRWRAHANLLFSNWLNYYLFQVAPSRREDIGLLNDLYK